MTRSRPLTGCGTALVTPFQRDGAVDEGALRALVDWQIEEGIHFLVPCGSTGEAATMTFEEHRRVVEIVVERVSGRVPVVAGAGTNDTRRAVAMSRELEAVGAFLPLFLERCDRRIVLGDCLTHPRKLVLKQLDLFFDLRFDLTIVPQVRQACRRARPLH